MKAQTYKYVLALMTVALMGTSYALLNSQMHAGVATGSETESIGYTGMVCKQVIRANGVVEPQFCDHNIVTLNGTNFTTSQLFGAPSAAAATEIENISLGNGTGTSPPQTGDTSSFGGIIEAGCSGLAPSNTLSWINIPNATAGTYITGSGNVSANHKWTAGCGSGTGIEVNRTAISSTTLPFFAVNQFTNVFLQTNDQLNVTWYVWIT